jgi:hypothetical protein
VADLLNLEAIEDRIRDLADWRSILESDLADAHDTTVGYMCIAEKDTGKLIAECRRLRARNEKLEAFREIAEEYLHTTERGIWVYKLDRALAELKEASHD